MSAILALGLALAAAAHLLDEAAYGYARHSGSALVAAMARWTDIGESQWYLVPAGLLFIGIALLDWQSGTRRRQARLAFLFGQAGYAFAAVAVAGILNNILKLCIGRARPKLHDMAGTLHFEPFTPGYDFASFPSGHSTTIGAVAMVLMLWFPRWRAPILALCALAALTRVAALAHYPSDVVAGFLLGLLYALFLARWLARRGLVFRFEGRALLPAVRLTQAWRTGGSGRAAGENRGRRT